MAGRPREFDKEAALKQARDLFWERGYEGVSMADLSSALGLASARLYAAFGSKEQLFRDAVLLYEAEEGGFADRALAEEPTAGLAVERLLREAINLYTRETGPRGCMVVSSATNCASENDSIGRWLEEHRRVRTAAIVQRIRQAAQAGELSPGTDADALGNLCAASLHGISVQARDGATKESLLKTVPLLLSLFG